jgi:hypothetical protein
MPRVLVVTGELHHGRRHRRQHDDEVAANGGHHATADERRRVLERPDELVDHLHHVNWNGGTFGAFGHQEDRNLVIARAHEAYEGTGPLVILAVDAQVPVDQHSVDA